MHACLDDVELPRPVGAARMSALVCLSPEKTGESWVISGRDKSDEDREQSKVGKNLEGENTRAPFLRQSLKYVVPVLN